MNKKILTCLLTLAMVAALAFSAGAVCARTFVADVASPVDETFVFDDAEDETVILYSSAEVPENTEPALAAETEKSPVKSVLVCIGIGLVIALVVTLSVKSSYKPVHRRRDAAEYLVDGSLQITASNESFVRSETTERTIEKQNSGQ